MIMLELSHEELDVLCQGLNEAATSREAAGDSQVANVYEMLRRAIRVKHPHNMAMAALVERYNDNDIEAALMEVVDQ